jgi:hypothetical protein
MEYKTGSLQFLSALILCWTTGSLLPIVPLFHVITWLQVFLSISLFSQMKIFQGIVYPRHIYISHWKLMFSGERKSINAGWE